MNGRPERVNVLMTGCEMIGCKSYKDGKCYSDQDFVNKETGEDMCFLNSSAISREEYDELKAGQPCKYKLANTELPFPRVGYISDCGFQLVELEGYKRDLDYGITNELSLPKGNCMKCGKTIEVSHENQG